jgi:hypothetical protein
MATQLYIHAGAPRTATTALQKSVFPRMRGIRYLGKLADNRTLPGEIQPFELIRQAGGRIEAGDPDGIEVIRLVLPTVLKALKIQNHDVTGADWRHELVRIFAGCVDAAASSCGGASALFSDESLIESVSGVAANTDRADYVPLEQLHEVGLLERASVSVVLRDPEEFLRASYYKAIEFRRRVRDPAISFDEYIRRQIEIHDRAPSASRVFLCRHRAATRHLARLCPRLVVTDYRDLVQSPHVLDTLLGVPTGEEPVALADLPRENNSWRDEAANAYILGAEGVPAGLNSVQEYALTFPETLVKYQLDQLFAADAISPDSPPPTQI